jgi:PPOX class probable F420-dependent enzyme
MEADELLAFLSGEPAHTGILATIRADGRPHVAPVWFVLDTSTAAADSPVGDIMFNTGTDTVKGRNLQRDPRVSFCIENESPPFSFVTIDGIATVSDALDDVVRWATSIGGRYMGQENAEALGRRNGVPGELVVRLRPTKIVAVAALAD